MRCPLPTTSCPNGTPAAEGYSCQDPRRRPEGIFVNPFEQGEIAPDLFRKACEFGLEGLVSKHRDRPYQSGRSTHWIKVKNRKHQAFDRVQEAHRR
jgi:bifunctional non-homologous end joining protein LigD